MVGFGNAASERFVRSQLPVGMVDSSLRRSGGAPRGATTRRLPLYEHPVPEHLGYGSYEDSMRSVKAVSTRFFLGVLLTTALPLFVAPP